MFVYLIRSNTTGNYKVGSSKKPYRRIEQLQTGNDSEISLVEIFYSEHFKKIEKIIQNTYASNKTHGEWFSFDLGFVLRFNDICKKIENNIVLLKKFDNPYA